ncbi:O-antigen ligase family protein [Methylobacterium sp. Leaf118]|uniref:O-antigen ligase family protein n=1 Tax=Methylobacterium sp. Leaf118 TaxID=2876562 RepID=UPI001E4D08AE|nr:O-antigen ligase family protein [Methylobacterium sp. Leaf118]
MKDRASAIDRQGRGGLGGPSGAGAPSLAGVPFSEVAYAAFGLLVYLGVHVGLNSTGGDAEPTVDGMATLNQAMVLLLGLAFVTRHRLICTAALADVRPFLLLLLLAAASSLWSQAPEASLRRSLTLATLMMFAVYAHAVLGTLLICRLHVIVTGVVAFASLAMAAIVPSSGFDVGGYAGAVRGVFSQKNSLGDAMVVGTVALSGLVLHRRRVVVTDLVCLAIAAGTCILAQATTSFLLCGAVAVITAVILLLIDASALAVFALMTGLMAAVLALWIVWVVPVDLFELLGKDSSLTGRTEIWAAVRRAIADGSVLGHGYSAFWLPETPTARNVWAAIGWVTPSAHSGYLELQLELGLPGLLLVAVLGLTTLWVVARAWGAGRWATAGWAVIVLTTIAIINYDESSLPRPDIHLLQWILAFAACSAGARTGEIVLAGPVPGGSPRQP